MTTVESRSLDGVEWFVTEDDGSPVLAFFCRFGGRYFRAECCLHHALQAAGYDHDSGAASYVAFTDRDGRELVDRAAIYALTYSAADMWKRRDYRDTPCHAHTSTKV